MPLTLAILFQLAALAFQLRRPGRRSWFSVCTSTLAVVIAAHPYSAWLLIRGLEDQVAVAPRGPVDMGGVEAIVILSGGLREGANEPAPGGSHGRMTLAEDSTMRTLSGLDLYRQSGRPTILVTGGATAQSHGVPVARLMADRLLAEGVDRDDVLVEDRATTTWENGVLSAAVLRPRGIIRIALVTEALHLPRARRVFEAQGFAVHPVGCNYLARRPPRLPRALLPSASAAQGVHRAAHEWVGMMWYYLRGRFEPVAAAGPGTSRAGPQQTAPDGAPLR